MLMWVAWRIQACAHISQIKTAGIVNIPFKKASFLQFINNYHLQSMFGFDKLSKYDELRWNRIVHSIRYAYLVENSEVKNACVLCRYKICTM